MNLNGIDILGTEDHQILGYPLVALTLILAREYA